MSPKYSTNIFRRVLEWLLDWVDRMERLSPRSQKHLWYRKEIHFPSIIVAVVSSFILFFSLYSISTLELTQSAVLAFLVIIIVTLFSIYLRADHKKLTESEDAMALLAINFFISLIWIIGISQFSKGTWWLNPYATPVGIAPLLTTLLLQQWSLDLSGPGTFHQADHQRIFY